jgi:uncharacterized DUF497 family protein
VVIFDARKDAINRKRRGLSLAQFVDMDLAASIAVVDARRDYGETRYIVVGPLAGRVCVAVVTYRDGDTRVISLRKANLREVRKYEATRS